MTRQEWEPHGPKHHVSAKHLPTIVLYSPCLEGPLQNVGPETEICIYIYTIYIICIIYIIYSDLQLLHVPLRTASAKPMSFTQNSKSKSKACYWLLLPPRPDYHINRRYHFIYFFAHTFVENCSWHLHNRTSVRTSARKPYVHPHTHRTYICTHRTYNRADRSCAVTHRTVYPPRSLLTHSSWELLTLNRFHHH